MYYPQEGNIKVHKTCVKPYPNFPAGHYWYGSRRRGPGGPFKRVDNILADHISETPDPAFEELPHSTTDPEVLLTELKDTDHNTAAGS